MTDFDWTKYLGRHYKGRLLQEQEKGYEFRYIEDGVMRVIEVRKNGETIGAGRAMYTAHAFGECLDAINQYEHGLEEA